MALTDEQSATLSRLQNKLAVQSGTDLLNRNYYRGQQRLRHMGLALPPEMTIFETVVNWPRSYVDALRARQQMRALFLPGEDTADPGLREGYEANNLDSESQLQILDGYVYGRSFVTVGTNEDDPEHPLISVESPMQMVAESDPRKRRLTAAARFYGSNEIGQPQYATLYLPDETLWLENDRGKWVDAADPDQHRLGRVPVVMFLNRRMTGDYCGESEMSDIVPLTDAACRVMTNAGVAMETHAVPQKYVLGASRGDFVDAAGDQIPAWETYFSAIWATGNKDAKFGQFTASDMANFERMINLYAQQASGLTGLPMRYFGQMSANPPSADAIRADESRLIRAAEMKNTELGDFWGWVFALYLRFRDGDWVDGRRIGVDWYDPATPTVAARTDAAVKVRQVGALSKRGLWTELGWSEARIDQELQWLEDEASDATLLQITRDLTGGLGATAGG